MAFEDLYGLPVSTPSDTAAQAYRRGIELMLSAWPGGSEALDSAIEADTDFASGPCRPLADVFDLRRNAVGSEKSR